MKVLITGGCGFLGSNLAESFLEDGANVFVVDGLFREGSNLNLNWLRIKTKNKFYFEKGDVSDWKFIEDLFKKKGPFDYVCHVAGQVAMTTSLKDPRNDLKTNVFGTFNILEAVRNYSPDALVAFSSTNKVYGDLKWVKVTEENTRYKCPDFLEGFDESIPLDFSTPYGCSKGSADQYVRDWSRVYGIKTVVFRHSSIYGGRQYSTYDQGWIGWFCSQAIKQSINQSKNKVSEPFTISGNGKQVRDVLHAKDIVDLYKAAYENKNILNGEIFNIGGGIDNSLSILELLSYISSKLNIDNLNYLNIARRESDQDVFIADVSKANHLLNWRPKVSYKDGIKMMIEWCNKNNI